MNIKIYGSGKSLSAYKKRPSWKFTVEIDDANVPDELKMKPWAFEDWPINLELMAKDEPE